MSAVGSMQAEQLEGDSHERRVSPLELFFDLVFVFALTQITAFLASHLTWGGVLQGMALLAALWGAWMGYSWLTNAVPADDAIPARLIILSAMGAMLVASLAVPGAFGENGVIFGLAYFVVRLLGWPSRCSQPGTRPTSGGPSSGWPQAFWSARRCSSWPVSSTTPPRARSGSWPSS